MNELKGQLGLDEWLELIKEDKNLNSAYISIAQYIYLLETQLKKQQKINQKAIEYIKEKQKIQYKFALSHIECDDLLEILEGKEETDIYVGTKGGNKDEK